MAAGRYAPSPTGDLHVGNLRTALLAHLFARAAGDALLLRIDDLDPATASVEYERSQRSDLAAFEIDFDGPVTRQSDRTDHYVAAIDRLESEGLTYRCFCSRREIREAASAPHVHLPDGAYPGTCRDLSTSESNRRSEERPAALRVRAERTRIEFVDRVYGTTTAVVDDFVVRRNDGVPSYNLATVVDDADQSVEEVVRGEDLRTGTARQIWLQEALGLRPTHYAHVPLLVNAEGRRLAKRDGAVTLADLGSDGWTPLDIRSLLAASLGLCEPTERPSMTELVDRFLPDAIPVDDTVWIEPTSDTDIERVG